MKIMFNGQDEGTVQFDSVPLNTRPAEDELEGPQQPEIRRTRGIIRESMDGSQDELSAEEARVFFGMQQRREAVQRRDQSLGRSLVSESGSFTPRQSWNDGEYIPVQIEYDRT